MFSFSFSCSGDHRDLHSFPTRRSSDLPPARWPTRWSCARAASPSRGGVARSTHRPAKATRPSRDRKSTRLNSSHLGISYAVFCLKKKKKKHKITLHDKTTRINPDKQTL